MSSVEASIKRSRSISRIACAIGFLVGGAIPGTSAIALECGLFKFPRCSGLDGYQYAGNFNPGTGYGGFGGGDCKATRTPVIFIHGNGDNAINWDSPIKGSVAGYVPPSRSVYEEFKRQGYNDCELFGVTYLATEEQKNAQDNFNRREKYRIIIDFISAVKAYTGSSQVDLVAHSLGVSMSLAALKAHDAWGSVRRFVNIAGGIRGLSSCLYVGPANPSAPTCGSENIFDPYLFGFYPYFNRWTWKTGEYSLRQVPYRQPKVRFYTIHAGNHDELHCTTLQGWNDCAKGALFNARSNIMAQLNVGAGSTATKINFDFTKWWNPVSVNIWGGDADGLGHFKAKNNTGAIIYTMLNTDCRDLSCKGPYKSGPVTAELRSP